MFLILSSYFQFLGKLTQKIANIINFLVCLLIVFCVPKKNGIQSKKKKKRKSIDSYRRKSLEMSNDSAYRTTTVDQTTLTTNQTFDNNQRPEDIRNGTTGSSASFCRSLN